jgi:hypothetical protein
VAVSVLKTKNHSSKASFPLSINLSLYFFSGDAQLYYNPHFKVQPISLSGLKRKSVFFLNAMRSVNFSQSFIFS